MIFILFERKIFLVSVAFCLIKIHWVERYSSFVAFLIEYMLQLLFSDGLSRVKCQEFPRFSLVCLPQVFLQLYVLASVTEAVKCCQ